MRMLPRSIHGRMLLLAVLSVLIALAGGGAIITRIFERSVTGGIDERLDSELAVLASTVDNDGHIDGGRLKRVRGALNGDRGWGWRIVAPATVIGSLRAAPQLSPQPVLANFKDGQSSRPYAGRDGRGQEVRARELTIQTRAGPVVLIAMVPRYIGARAIWDTLLPLLIALTIIGAALAAATILQLHLGLRPLRRLRADVAAIRAGAIGAVDENQPDELRPLAIELNALTRDNEAALTAARASAANLAHALKTPVATLALDLADDPRHAEQVARIDATIRHHLSRARSAVFDKRSATALAPVVADLAATISKIHGERHIAIDSAVDPGLTVAVARTDLDEIVGNLLDNAARFASTNVFVRTSTAERTATLSVTDDGPGIPARDRAKSTEAGVRLDERGDGHGFGLSITSDLVQLYGGKLSLDEAPGGGLTASVTLPTASGVPD